MNNPFTVSLIVTTYNNPTRLLNILNSVTQQSRLPDSTIIADDGSSPETQSLINEFPLKELINIRHVWQEDHGYRRSAILNKSINQSKDDYIVFVDCDEILHKHFVKDHVECSYRKTVLLGGRTNIVERPNEFLTTPPKLVRVASLFLQGRVKNEVRSQKQNLINRTKGLIKAIRIPYRKPKDGKILQTRGGNMSAWREDLLEVNGYDQDFEGWGWEDIDMVDRMSKNGCTIKQIIGKAICFHADHESPPENEANKSLISTTRPVFCLNGIKKGKR